VIVALVALAFVSGFGIRPLLMPELISETSAELSEEQMQAIHAEISSLYEAISQLDLGSSGTTDAQLQAELNNAKTEIIQLQALLKSMQEANQTNLVIPLSKIVGELGWREIGPMLQEVVPEAGLLAGTHKIITKEAIQLFLASVNYPENIGARTKLWYLIYKFADCGIPKLCVGHFVASTMDEKKGEMLLDGIIVIVQDNDGEYKIFTIDEESQLIPFESGSWKSFSANFLIL